MAEALLAELLRRAGPFIIPVTVFAAGVVGYGVLYLYYRWRDDAAPKD